MSALIRYGFAATPAVAPQRDGGWVQADVAERMLAAERERVQRLCAAIERHRDQRSNRSSNDNALYKAMEEIIGIGAVGRG